MAPVIQGIANGLSQTLGPLEKLLLVGGCAGDIVFVHATGAQKAPFVMVAPQPDLGDVFKPAVLIDFLRIDVAVIVDDRHIFCVVKI